MTKHSLISLLALLWLASCNKDENPPVVELAGRNPDTVYVNTHETYPDPGAKATDAEDGDVEVLVSGSVDMKVAGNYVITYSAQDKSNNFSETRQRHVAVIRAQGNYSAYESCSSSGVNNYAVSASPDNGNDTITLAGFPISPYSTRAVAKDGGYSIYPQTISPVMDVEGSISCDGSTLTVNYTRTSLQGPGTTENCTATLRK